VLGTLNNVGLARHETIDAVDQAVFAAVMDLNVRPALQLIQALLPGMRAMRFGRIIDNYAPCDSGARIFVSVTLPRRPR